MHIHAPVSRHGPAGFACALLVLGLASLLCPPQSCAQPPSATRSLKITEPPAPPIVTTYREGAFNIHIYERPGSRATPAQRSVLLLGTFSDPGAVLETRQLLNPATGRPYDVVIGLAADSLPDEASRVIAKDHFYAGENADTLKQALLKHFKGPLEAKSLDTHSNGTTVGIVGILRGAFRGVTDLHVMGPDVGYGGAYLNKDSLAGLKSHGVEAVHVYRNRGDIIPALGAMSQQLVTSIPTAKLGELAYKAVLALQGLSTAAGGGLPMIHYREFEPTGVGFENHFLLNYIALRASPLKGEPASAKPPRDAKGVRIYIDDEILEHVLRSGTPEDAARRLQDLGVLLARAPDDVAREDILARFADGLKAAFRNAKTLRKLGGLVAVSLKATIARAERHVSRWDSLPQDARRPGAITRIHGYAVDEAAGDILILGRRDTGAPIELDELRVGLCSVWKERQVPFVSLDPDPTNIDGPQQVRVHGIPRDSGFALAMLEADYLLKRTLANLEAVSVAGYESLKDILTKERGGRDFGSRFWLYPIQPATGDIHVSADGNLAVFAGGTQILSEEMVNTREGLVGTGTTFGPAERAAASATRHYPALAAEKPAFARLQGLFDIVLLAKIWQRMNVQSPLLEQLCRLPYTAVSVPDTYPGIRVDVSGADGSGGLLSGGVMAQVGAGRRASLAFDDPGLQALASAVQTASRSGRLATELQTASVSVALPDPGEQAARELARIRLVKQLREGKLDEAREQASRLIATDPYDAGALLFRALAHFRRNDLSAASADATRALELEPDRPDIVVLSSLIAYEIDALEGRMESGLQAVERAVAHDPASVRAHVLRAGALARFGRSQEARAELRKALQLDPTSALAYATLAVVEMRQGWVAQGKKWAALAHRLNPQAPQIRAVLAMAELFGASPERGEQLAREVLAHSTSDPPSKILALTVLGLQAAGRGEWTAVDGFVAQAGAIAPFSPDTAAAMAVAAHDSKEPALAQRYLQQAERIAPQHPTVTAARAALQR